MVKIYEFVDHSKNETFETPWDMCEDLVVFMKNDPMFYRKEYYPAMTRMSDLYRVGKKFDFAKEMMPVIEKAKTQYCEKYKMPKPAEAMFNEEDNVSIVERLQEEEYDRIRKGEY